MGTSNITRSQYKVKIMNIIIKGIKVGITRAEFDESYIDHIFKTKIFPGGWQNGSKHEMRKIRILTVPNKTTIVAQLV